MLFILTALIPDPGAGATDDDTPFWTGRPNAAQFTGTQERRLARAREAVDRVLAVAGRRTVENTLRPYDESQIQLDAVGSQSSLIQNVHPDPALRTAAEECSRKAAALGTELSLNRALYDAIAAIDLAGADAETRYYVERELRDFRLAGVDRDDATREKIQQLRDELVRIGQEFDRNIRGDVRTIAVAGAADLAGLPQDFLDSHKPGADGSITITTNYPDYGPVMTYATHEDVRRRLYHEFSNRAFPQNEEVLARLIARRAELARVLGHASWADYATANKMVGSGQSVREFIDRIVDASGERARNEYDVLLARKRADDPGAATVNMWEAGYWSEMVRKSSYDFDAQSVRPYFPYDRVQQGVLDVTSRLFGVTFRRVPNVPVWHPSVECWEMLEDGALAGRFYLDMHPRPDKYSHAAQFDVRTGIAGRQIPEAALICNFAGGTAGDPGLMEHGDVTTFFHEFGHLIHALFAGRRRWCGTAGIKTEHDFIEAPSQMLEEWAWDPATLATFAKHYQTNAPIPAALVRQMKRANDYGKGLGVRRQMVYADLSLSIYDRDPQRVDPDSIAQALVAKYQPFPHVEGTHFQCAFGHLDGYSATYYTYMWSLVIAKDLFSVFDRQNLLAPDVAKRYRDTVLAPGGSAPAAALVESFLGRPFNFAAYQTWLNEDDEPPPGAG